MRKTLSLLFAAAIGMTSLFALTSCGDDKEDPTPTPSKNHWTLTVGGKTTTYSVKTLGVYHESGQGFNMLLCDQNVEYFSDMPQPDCNWVRLDFPEDILDKVITNPEGLDGAKWSFYYQTNVECPEANWYSDAVKACNVSIKYPSPGNFKIEMSLTMFNGDKFALNFDGNASAILGNYLTDDYYFLYNSWWYGEASSDRYVESAGIYHGNGGYNMLICDDENIYYKSDMSKPSCNWVRLDFPDEAINKIVTTPVGLDGEDWSFYFQSSDSNPEGYWRSEKISKCYCRIYKKDAGKFKIAMRLWFVNGKEFVLAADIKPSVVYNYITPWSD